MTRDRASLFIALPHTWTLILGVSLSDSLPQTGAWLMDRVITEWRSRLPSLQGRLSMRKRLSRGTPKVKHSFPFIIHDVCMTPRGLNRSYPHFIGAIVISQSMFIPSWWLVSHLSMVRSLVPQQNLRVHMYNGDTWICTEFVLEYNRSFHLIIFKVHTWL